MKKGIIITLLTGAFMIGAGFSASAEGMCPDNMNFGKMKAMHPELTTKELQEKYEDCHGTMGAENSKNFMMDCMNHM
jgi:hypothetical protein